MRHRIVSLIFAVVAAGAGFIPYVAHKTATAKQVHVIDRPYAPLVVGQLIRGHGIAEHQCVLGSAPVTVLSTVSVSGGPPLWANRVMHRLPGCHTTPLLAHAPAGRVTVVEIPLEPDGQPGVPFAIEE